MVDLNKIRLFRMIHIKNIPHILQFGVTHVLSNNSNPNFVSIGNKSLIDTRNSRVLENHTSLGDYIPFYFAYRTPMLYVIQKNKSTPTQDIVYCVSSVQKILDQNLDFIFSDGHAVSNLSKFYYKERVQMIAEVLDFKAIQSKYWNDESDLDLKRKKEAEFLVRGDIGIDGITGYITYNEKARKKLLSFGIPNQNVVCKPDFYF